ncbi:hypothetical protein ZWY2020_034688 [Hordeum vulgare]|nr:hypothetical protein ZWY2020_034688 [Hordeum vulgare]
MAPDAVVLALSFARPSHQPVPEHLNRIHPSRRARDPPEPLPARRCSFSMSPHPPWGHARGQSYNPAACSTPGALPRLSSPRLRCPLWIDDVHYLLGIKYMVAVRKAGYALVGSLMPEYDPVAKISIIPRGQAGGLTFFAPSEEKLESGLYNRSYLENQMAVALGGRVAEEVIIGQDNVTTRASSDFMHVSRVARQMVERFGLMYPFWENEEIVPMRAMKMAWVPYVPLEDRLSRIDSLKTKIFTLGYTQQRSALKCLKEE